MARTAVEGLPKGVKIIQIRAEDNDVRKRGLGDNDGLKRWLNSLGESHGDAGQYDCLYDDNDTEWAEFEYLSDKVVYHLKAKKNKKRRTDLFGDHTVDMKRVEAVLDHLTKLQDKYGLNGFIGIHSSTDLAFELSGREETMTRAVQLVQKRKLGIESKAEDRTATPMMFFSGLPGLGKTRMLEEWNEIFKQAGISGPSMGVIVTYGNGSSPEEFEDSFPVEAAFSWRMLYRLFLKGNSREATSWTHTDYLPANAPEMTLELGLKVIRAAAEKYGMVKSDEVLSLFVGVDEYQRIPTGLEYDKEAEDQEAERVKTNLWKLISVFQRATTQHDKIHIYPAFAGTKFGVLSIAGSSVASVARVPLRFLAPQEMEEAVRSQLPERLFSSTFRGDLFQLGGIPRPCLEYAKDQSWQQTWTSQIKSRWDLNSHDLLKLLACALTGRRVSSKDKSCVGKYSWGALADQGMCILEDDGELSIPYCVFRLATERDAIGDEWSWAEKCLIQNLNFLKEHVDDVLYDLEPWQLWEKFGACVFAMKINAFMILGETQLEFSELCQKAVCNGCKYWISLIPMEVHQIHEDFSVDVPEEVVETKHNKVINWLDGDLIGEHPLRYCLINGTSGCGLDVIASLKLAESSAVLLYCDQRKVEAASLGTKKAKELMKKATIKPKILPRESKCVRGLFSILASFNGVEADIPQDSFVLSYKQHREFYGKSLSFHPACRAYIDVNHDNKSTLALLSSIRKDVEAVLTRRQHRKFTSKDEFVEFCDKELNAKLTDQERTRICGF